MDQTWATGEAAKVTGPPPLLDDDDPALFPKLTDAQVQMLTPHGEVRRIEAGDVLWAQGESNYDVMVVLEGLVSVVMNGGPQAREVAVQRPGDLMVELNLFTGQGSEAEGIEGAGRIEARA